PHPHLYSFPTRRSSDLHVCLRAAGIQLQRALELLLSTVPVELVDALDESHRAVSQAEIRIEPQRIGCSLHCTSIGDVGRHRPSRSEEHTSELQSPYDLV